MKKVFITGITGTLGQIVSRQLLNDPHLKVFGIARDEQKLRKIAPHPRLVLYLGDVRDKDRIQEATRDSDLLFHFASLKCVDFLESNPDEAKKTIIDGTENILHSQRVNEIPRVVFTSTDKACLNINAYGAAKFLAECLVSRNANNVIVRYGNVLASRGSVVPEFVKSLQKDKTINLTNEKMTRFFMTQEEAADFVIQNGFGKTGGLKVKKDMKSCYMKDLGLAVADILGISHPTINITGIRPGEKLHEDLIQLHGQTLHNSFMSQKFTKDELREFLTPIVNNLRLKPRSEVIRRRLIEAVQ